MSPIGWSWSIFFCRDRGRRYACLGLLVLVLAGYRFSLISRGHFYWGDERCFLPADDFVHALWNGEYRAAATHLYAAPGKVPPARPGFIVVSAIPVVAQQAFGALTGVGPDASRYYDVVSAFNVLVALGITGCLYSLALMWTGQACYALLICGVYSLLCGANIWIRHMVPYPASMLLFLLALCLLSCPQREGRQDMRYCVVGGMLSALAYACYPGYYPLVIVNASVAAAQPPRRVRSLPAFALSFALVVAAFELLARFAGRSYLSDLRTLSGSVAMGYPKENYIFIWRYLRDVEGPVGVLLFVTFAGFAFLVLWRRRTSLPVAARVAMLASVACYLLHATVGVSGGRMVFYGRLVGAFIPFLVGGAVLGLMHLRRPIVRRFGAATLAGASIYSFVSFALRYSEITYPADFLRSTMAALGREVSYPSDVLWDFSAPLSAGRVEQVDPALSMVADTRPDGSDEYVYLASHEQARAAGKPFIAVNLKFMWFFRERSDRFTPPEGYRLVAEAIHPEVFPATGYEGRKPWERERVRKRQYTMRMYQRVDSAGPKTTAP